MWRGQSLIVVMDSNGDIEYRQPSRAFALKRCEEMGRGTGGGGGQRGGNHSILSCYRE